jgi:AcrR family transcriptional regulator
MTGTAPGRAARSRGDTRQRILDTALRLFAERGYAGTSIRDIAEELGVTKAAVHYHFAAKEQIVVGLLRPFLQQFEDLVERRAGGPGDARGFLLEVGGLLEASGPLLSVLSADPSVATASEDLHAHVERVAARSAEVLAGPGADGSRLVRAHCALGALFSGWDFAYRASAGPLDAQHLEVVLSAALAALDSSLSPAGGPCSPTPAVEA